MRADTASNYVVVQGERNYSQANIPGNQRIPFSYEPIVKINKSAVPDAKALLVVDSASPAITGTAVVYGSNFVVYYDPTGSGAYCVATTAPVFQGEVFTADTNFGNLNPVGYVSGTAIATTQGITAVESLQIGDELLTHTGTVKSVKWIGRRSYAGRFLTSNSHVHPIRLRTGSLGGGLPLRDLLVSPEHALFLNGLLVPARLLTNGSTILQERQLMRVDYYHVELDTHQVILAEGASSESFLDNDSRDVFHNAGEYAAMYRDMPVPGKAYAQRVESGFELELIRQQLTVVAQGNARAA